MRHELTIPMVPSKNILGQSRWHRNSHNDRLVWQRKVAEAVDAAGLTGTWTLAWVEVTWGRRKPTLRDPEHEAIWKESVVALAGAGLDIWSDDIWMVDASAWTGRGAGTTRLVLDRDE